jgi:hypothetical protein
MLSVLKGGAMKIQIRFAVLPECKPHRDEDGKIREIELCRDWWIEIFYKGRWISIWIPAGYTFDGASIPRMFWSIIGSPFDPVFWAAALIHDWLYLMHQLPRSVADEVLRLALIQCEAFGLQARIMWAAVRSCGYPAWTNSAEDAEERGKMLCIIAGRPDKDKFVV